MRLRSVLAVSVLIIFDQLTKYLVTTNLALHENIPLLGGIIHITRVHNTGIAFGLFKGMVFLFIFLSAVVAFLIILWAQRFRTGYNILRIGLLLILAGTIGNLIDRIRLGYVIDFIDLRIWPVFNIADAAITIGGAFLIGHIFFSGQGAKR